MKKFFSQIENLPIDSSVVSAELFLRGVRSTGLIEKQFLSGQLAILILAGGMPITAYLLENDKRIPMPLVEFSAVPEASISSIHAIKMPDVAGRLTTLAFESTVQNMLTITDESAWGRQVEQWKSEQWNGLVEIRSETMHGFALFLHGELQRSDTIFSTSQGFVADFPDLSSVHDSPWDICTYSLPVSEQVYQSTILRYGAMDWIHKILCRYEEMVGHKLLLTLDRELNRQIHPWNWNIVLNETDIQDSHFFAYPSDAEHAYRALFMSMGAQMNIVLGSNLTQRILSETFEQIHPEERAILQTLRLIPAAFSE